MSYQVLVVADGVQTRLAITEALHKCHCVVHVAEGLSDALIRAKDIQPRVVFISLKCMAPSAWELVEQFRDGADPESRKLVAVAPSDYDAMAIREAGFHHFLAEPIDLRALQLVLYGNMPAVA